ncbi:MAG: CHAT domain-containing protein [Solirubrobacteraceae bacterium]
MSIYESRIKTARTKLERAGRKEADEKGREAKAAKEADRYERDARSTKSASTAKSKWSSAERKRAEASKAREAAARAADAVQKARKEVHDAERKLSEETARADSRERKQIERDRTREEQDRARRDQERDRELRQVRAQAQELRSQLDRSPWADAPEAITVLLIAASPENEVQLRLDKEFRVIQQRVQASEYRDRVRMELRLATQVVDLLQILNETKPHVVHFSGHGNNLGLAFEDDDGKSKTLGNGELGWLLRTCSDRIRLAVFNSCESAEQASRACEHIDAAIGMDASVTDEAAKVFAGQLYSALAFGRPLDQAFEQACFQVKVALGSTSGEPRLHTAEGVDPSDLYVVSPPGAQAA